jgi:hypothetical protein
MWEAALGTTAAIKKWPLVVRGWHHQLPGIYGQGMSRLPFAGFLTFSLRDIEYITKIKALLDSWLVDSIGQFIQ